MTDKSTTLATTAHIKAEIAALSGDRVKAMSALNGIVNGATLIAKLAEPTWGEMSITDCVAELVVRANRVQKNDLSDIENTLTAQIHSLDTLFQLLVKRSYMNMGQNMLPTMETYMRLGLKAQAQCRATAEALAVIKNPPVVIAKQANITNGPQQVNNGIMPARTEKPEPVQSKLLEESHEQRMDTGAALAASGSNPALAAVEPIHRPAHRKRKGQGRP